MNNPYKKVTPGKVPVIMRVPMFDFSSNTGMEEELENKELCIARIPNTIELGFTHHVALVYKDDKGDVYSISMVQHNGVLKDTKENRDAISVKIPDEIPVQSGTRSSGEIRKREQSSGDGHGESSPKSSENEEQSHNPLPQTSKGRNPTSGPSIIPQINGEEHDK